MCCCMPSENAMAGVRDKDPTCLFHCTRSAVACAAKGSNLLKRHKGSASQASQVFLYLCGWLQSHNDLCSKVRFLSLQCKNGQNRLRHLSLRKLLFTRKKKKKKKKKKALVRIPHGLGKGAETWAPNKMLLARNGKFRKAKCNFEITNWGFDWTPFPKPSLGICFATTPTHEVLHRPHPPTNSLPVIRSSAQHNPHLGEHVRASPPPQLLIS